MRTNDARWQLLYNLVDVGQLKIRGCPFFTYYGVGGGGLPRFKPVITRFVTNTSFLGGLS